MNTWLSGMSPGSTTSGALGSTAPAIVVVVIVVVVVAGTVVEGAGVVVGVEEIGPVVTPCDVGDVAASVSAGLDCDALPGPLHAEATSAIASPDAIVDVMRMIHFLLTSSLMAWTVRTSRRADPPPQVRRQPELQVRGSPGAVLAVRLSP